MCGSILGEVKRQAKGKCVAAYLGRLREQRKESVWQYPWGDQESNKKKVCGRILGEVERAAKKKVCGSIFREVKRAAKGKCVAEYLGRLREQQKESVWQYTWEG